MDRKIIFILILLLLATSGWARDWEYYLEYKVKMPLNKKQKLFLNLKEETRYKNSANYYHKSFFGISKKISSDLEFALYYAFKGKRKDDWYTLHLFWPQVDYRIHLKRFNLVSSTKLERHCSSNTYKFREKLKLIFPLTRKLNFLFGDEGRIFSLFDNPYFGENEALCGFNFKLFRNLNLEIYYDLRRIKNIGKWQNTSCLRTVLNFRF